MFVIPGRQLRAEYGQNERNICVCLGELAPAKDRFVVKDSVSEVADGLQTVREQFPMKGLGP